MISARRVEGSTACLSRSRPRATERCAATINLRFGLEAGPAVENLILTYDLEILPSFLQFERHDQIVLLLDPSSVEKAVEWFDRKALTFTKTYISIFFNPHYQKGSEGSDIVLGMTFPRMFAKGQAEHGGATYYFFTEESQKAFEQDPDRYVGVGTAPSEANRLVVPVTMGGTPPPSPTPEGSDQLGGRIFPSLYALAACLVIAATAWFLLRENMAYMRPLAVLMAEGDG